MNATRNRLRWSMKVSALKKSRERSKFGRAAMQWIYQVRDLKIEYKEMQTEAENSPDYLYLQSIIQKKVPNLNAPEIGVQLTEILNRNSENSAFISYVKQAVAVYRQAFLSMSGQFTWEQA